MCFHRYILVCGYIMYDCFHFTGTYHPSLTCVSSKPVLLSSFTTGSSNFRLCLLPSELRASRSELSSLLSGEAYISYSTAFLAKISGFALMYKSDAFDDGTRCYASSTRVGSKSFIWLERPEGGGHSVLSEKSSFRG